MSNTVNEAVKNLIIIIDEITEVDSETSAKLQNVVDMLADKKLLFEEWSIDDVHQCSVMYDQAILTDDQCIEVLSIMDNRYDCNDGINWEFISSCIERVI